MLEINNVAIGYKRDSPVLDNLNYRFENKIYMILGESGCGKTTLLRTIAGLMQPLSGEILLDGHKVRTQKEDRYKLYMLHQNYTSFGWLTCLENILIGIKARKDIVRQEDIERAYEMLVTVGLEEKENKYPGELSGGQRQRLALARTIFIDPPVLLLDEPLSALDPDTRYKMQDLVMKVHKRTRNTIIMVTHSEEEAHRMGDVVINLNERKEKERNGYFEKAWTY